MKYIFRVSKREELALKNSALKIYPSWPNNHYTQQLSFICSENWRLKVSSVNIQVPLMIETAFRSNAFWNPPKSLKKTTGEAKGSSSFALGWPKRAQHSSFSPGHVVLRKAKRNTENPGDHGFHHMDAMIFWKHDFKLLFSGSTVNQLRVWPRYSPPT